MRSIIIFALIAFAAMPIAAQEKVDITTRLDSLSYAIGMNIGQNFKMQSLTIDVDKLAAGMRDVLNGNTRLSEEQAGQVVVSFQQEMMQKQEAERAVAGEKHKSEGAAFLAENKDKDGVKTTASGLQYKVLIEGKGPKPVEADRVKTHYTGKLIDGTEFDSSIKRGEAAEFPVTGVIKGWTEALLMMPVGSKWILYIPSDLAYGDKGAGNVIPPHATLIFEIELLEILK